MATIFEKIIAGEIPATIVHRDDRVIAFRDISPQARVHVLIVPNKPIPTVNDVTTGTNLRKLRKGITRQKRKSR